MRKFVIKDHTVFGPGDVMFSITQNNYPILLDLLNKQLDVFDSVKTFLNSYNNGNPRPELIFKMQEAVDAADWSTEEEEEEDE